MLETSGLNMNKTKVEEILKAAGIPTQEEKEHLICRNAVAILAEMCAADEGQIIDLLTGYLWSEEEASKIRNIRKTGFDMSLIELAVRESWLREQQRVVALTQLFVGCKWSECGSLAELRPEDEKYVTKEAFLAAIDKLAKNEPPLITNALLAKRRQDVP